MIRVRHSRPRVLRVPGTPDIVVELHAGGLLRVREAGRRTWYTYSTGALLWTAAKLAADRHVSERTAEKRARRAARGKR